MTGSRAHLVLVPGFGGFDVLGPLAYFRNVVATVRKTGRLTVHTFQNLPTAGVETRARALHTYLAQCVDTGEVRTGDEIHLVGHSTGGLDARRLLSELDAGGLTHAALLRAAIRSVQFLSTPHRGSNLAWIAHRLHPLPNLAVRAVFVSLVTLGPLFWVTLGKVLRRARLVSGRERRDLMDAVVDILADAGSLGAGFERAQARSVFYALLRYASELGEDAGALVDLCPTSESAKTSEWSSRLAVRSIVTRAAVPAGERVGLFPLLDRLMRLTPPAALGEPCVLSSLLQPGEQHAVGLTDHDGVVSSVSMVWPDAARSFLVDADHADVIGHYEGSGGYDLLRSGSRFSDAEFVALWGDMTRFALGASAS
jgi:hypothetical protein